VLGDLVTRDEQESLELIPRLVRDKLDRVRVKLHLKDWQALTLTERARLRDLPCESAEERTRYAAELAALVLRVTGKPAENMQ
jgi:hypothetical protein